MQEALEWIPSGSPWLDKGKQVSGDQLAISIGLDNAIDAARRRGANVFDNIDKQAKVLEYARLKGVPLIISGTSDKTATDPEQVNEDDKMPEETINE